MFDRTRTMLSGPKVFCIGFNKTGTSSLHSFFSDCGLRSFHGNRWTHLSKLRIGFVFLLWHQCYSDGEQSDFVSLDEWFPRSLFILNDRDERDWLISRTKHVLRLAEALEPRQIFSSPREFREVRDFYTDAEATLTKWICERRIYTKQVQAYFDGREDFLRIDVTKDTGWEDRLNDFLAQGGLRPKRPGKTYHKNRRDPSSIADQELLVRCLAMVDSKLSSQADSRSLVSLE